MTHKLTQLTLHMRTTVPTKKVTHMQTKDIFLTCLLSVNV